MRMVWFVVAVLASLAMLFTPPSGVPPTTLVLDGQRKRKIKIVETWPWAHELETCFRTAFALVPP